MKGIALSDKMTLNLLEKYHQPFLQSFIFDH